MTAARLKEATLINNYRIIDLLGEGSKGYVYRCEKDGQQFAVKILKESEQKIRFEEVQQFRKETASLARLNHKNLTKIFDFGEFDGLLYVVMELAEGETLSARIQRGVLNQSEILHVAKEIASVFSTIHLQSIIHRDVKPENIIVQKDGIKLVDFGFGGEVEEFVSEETSLEFVGTLAYASPEQAGILKRMVDNRSDLYSLGVVLYQCATGHLPLTALDTNELLRMLATVKPRDPRELNTQVSDPLAKIILKLLEKDPDDRYQSADGLLYDLEKLSQWKSGEEFQLGQQDLSSSRQHRLPIVGREQELESLSFYFQEAASGHGQAVVVEGDGGLGKSRLTREVLKTAKKENFLILSSKCSAMEADKPLAMIHQALDGLAVEISKLEESSRSELVSRINELTRESQFVVSSLSEALKTTLGVTKSSEFRDRLQFMNMASEFLVQLSKVYSGLILHIDDIQWLDEASRILLGVFAKEIRSQKILVLSTARNDSSSLIGLEKFKTALKGNSLQVLQFKPLSEKAIGDLAKAYLGERPMSTDIIKKLSNVSKGNPFVLNEFLNKLMSSGLLQLKDEAWILVESDLSKVSLSDNVYDLVLSRLGSLPTPALKALEIASIIGFSFEINLLQKATGLSHQDLNNYLAMAAREGVIEFGDKGHFSFVHDRIREALTSSMTAESAKDANYHLAEIFAEQKDLDPGNVFDFARYTTQGYPEKNPLRTFLANLEAGKKALSNFASKEAFEYFNLARNYLESAAPEAKTQFEFWCQFGSACVNLAKMSEAREFFARAKDLAPDSLELARVTFLQAESFMFEGKYAQSWETFKLCLHELGYPFPNGKLQFLLSLVFHFFATYFLSVTKMFYGVARKNEEKEKRYKLITSVYERAGYLSYFRNAIPEMVLGTLIHFCLAHFLGPSREVVRSHITCANMWGAMFLKRLVRYHLIQVEKTASALSDPEVSIWAKKMSTISMTFIGQNVEAEKIAKETLPIVIRKSNAFEAGAHITDYIFHFVISGRSREAVELALSYLPIVDQMPNLTTRYSVCSTLYTLLNTIGRVSESLKYFEEGKKIVEELGAENSFIFKRFLGSKIRMSIDTKDYSAELEKQIETYQSHKSRDYHIKYYDYPIPYMYLELASSAPNEAERSRLMKKLVEETKKFGRVAKQDIFRCHYMALMAGIHRLKGEYQKAQAYIEHGDQMAAASGSYLGQFELLREKARLARLQNNLINFSAFSKRAYEMAQEFGWTLRMEDVCKEFGIEVSKKELSQTSITASTSRWEEGNNQRVINALLQVSLASSMEMDPQKQVASSLDEIISIMGAQRGYVFLLSEKTGQLEYVGGRDHNKVSLDAPRGFSSTIIDKVHKTKEPLVVAGSDEMEAIGSKSAVLHGLRSIMAVPILLQGQFRGVAYIDSSIAKGLFSKDDIETFSAIANHIAIAFENVRMMNVEASKRELQKDLELSGAVQKMLLPKVSQISTDKVDMTAFFRSAVQCGGDWWWLNERSDGKIWVFLGDVTGHGAGPAMITSTVAAVFRFCEQTSSPLTLPEIMKQVSHLLHSVTRKEYLMSALAFELDPATLKLNYWNAGSPGIFIFKKSGELLNEVGRGVLMGIEKFEIESNELQLEPGDRLVIPTDGILEMPTTRGKRIGFRQVVNIVKKYLQSSPQNAVESIIGELDKARGDHPQDDDMTLIMMDIK